MTGATWLLELGGTCTLRPYVVAFLLSFLVVAPFDIGPLRACVFTVWAFAVALLAELTSTRTGFPFGLYEYTGATRSQELFLSNVPFFVPLSYVFVIYACFAIARAFAGRSRRRADGAKRALDLRSRRRRADGAKRALELGAWSAAAIVLLSAVMDPAAVHGERWFLGPLYRWATPGSYYGVPWTNFVGWAVVTTIVVVGYLLVDERLGPRARASPILSLYGAVLLYVGLAAFNLVILFHMRELVLFAVGGVVHLAFITVALRRLPKIPRVEPR